MALELVDLLINNMNSNQSTALVTCICFCIKFSKNIEIVAISASKKKTLLSF